MVEPISLEEIGRLRQQARDEHFAAREARAAYTIEMTQRLASGAELDAVFVRTGEDLQAAVSAAQSRLRELDRRQRSMVRELSRQP